MPGRDKPLITRNGIPDPQAYNPQTGQWESFIGVSWGKTAGGLYVPIRVDNQGRQEVTLSGTINEIIKEYRDEVVGVGPVYYGATRGDSCLPLDVSAYKEIAFTIRNKGDRLIQLWAFQLYARADLPRNSDYNGILVSSRMSAGGGDVGDIPAGARLHVSSIDYPILLTPFSGLVLQFYTPGIQGSTLIDIVITGVRV